MKRKGDVVTTKVYEPIVRTGTKRDGGVNKRVWSGGWGEKKIIPPTGGNGNLKKGKKGESNGMGTAGKKKTEQ